MSQAARLQRRVERFHAAVDASWKIAHTALGLSCRGAGCWGCCRGSTRTHPEEGKALVDSLTPADWAHVEAHIGEALTNPLEGFCPLLDRETKRCRAYAHRPAVCRAYGVTSPPEVCHPGPESTEVVIPLPLFALVPEVLGTQYPEDRYDALPLLHDILRAGLARRRRA